MLTDKEFFRPEYLIEIIVRRKWYIIIPLTIAMMVGIYLSLSLPKVYRATTLILVQPQKVPTNYVRSIVTSTVEARLRTISEQIMSITNIERIIRNFNLFVEPQYKDMYWEDKIRKVRERITLSVSKGNTFSVSFNGKIPKTTMEVANALASYFIDENLKVREAQAISTSAFLEDELTGVKSKLKEMELKLLDFRKKNMGTLPEQLDTNLQALNRLQIALNENENRLIKLKDSLVNLENQPDYSTDYMGSMFTDNSNELMEENEELNELRLQYNALKTKYTDKHPDVKKLLKLIEGLEKENDDVEKNAEVNINDDTLFETPNINTIEIQKNDIKRNIEKINKNIIIINKQYAEYQMRIEKTPQTEQQLHEINRNYNNIKEQYDSLLNRKLESEIAVNMEKKQKGEQFKIVDPAKLPEKPYEPNLSILFGLFVSIGLGIGGALITLMEYFDSAFRRAEEIEPYLKAPVLAYIPKISTKNELRRKKVENVMSIIPIAFLAALFGVFTISTIKADEKSLILLENLGVIEVVETINKWIGYL